MYKAGLKHQSKIQSVTLEHIKDTITPSTENGRGFILVFTEIDETISRH